MNNKTNSLFTKELEIFGDNKDKALSVFQKQKVCVVGYNQISKNVINSLIKYGIGYIRIINPTNEINAIEKYSDTDVNFKTEELRPRNSDKLLEDSSFIICTTFDMQSKFEAWNFAKKNNTKRNGIFVSNLNSVFVQSTHKKDITGIFKRYTKGIDSYSKRAINFASQLIIDDTIKGLLYKTLPEEKIITFNHTEINPQKNELI